LATPPNHAVFICYRREDAAAAAGRIRDRLEEAFGARGVFMDVHEVPAGVDFRLYTRAVLEGSRVVLVIIGRHWLTASDAHGQSRLRQAEDFVRTEIEVALGGASPVVPVLVDGAAMPNADELPESIRDLAFRNAVVVRSDRGFRADTDELIAGLAALVREERDAQGPPREPAVDTSAAAATDGRTSTDDAAAVGSWLLREVIYSSNNWTSHAATHRLTRVRATVALLKPKGYVGRRGAAVLAAAKLMSGLDHPALTPVLDWGEAQGRVFVVIGTAPPTLLDCVNKGGPVNEIRALRWTSRLAEGLAHLHAKGVVHQLVGPDSVQLADSEALPLLGWPVFCTRAGTPLVDGNGESQVALVPLTAAPESFGRGGTIEPAADVYGLALVAYYALTGKYPHSSEDLMALILAKSQPPPDVRALAPAVSGPTALLVESMLDPSAARRPEAQAVHATCERILRRLTA